MHTLWRHTALDEDEGDVHTVNTPLEHRQGVGRSARVLILWVPFVAFSK